MQSPGDSPEYSSRFCADPPLPVPVSCHAVDHTTAVMTYKILKKLNLDQEKELVFFDGVDEKNDASPIFTHVMQGEGEIGRTAVRYLIDRIRGREVPERTYIPYDIVRGK